MSETITVQTAVQFKKITVPNFLIQLNKGGTTATIALKEIPQDVLDLLVCEFIADIYKKAGKTSPWSAE